MGNAAMDELFSRLLLVKCCEFSAKHFTYPHSINVIRNLHVLVRHGQTDGDPSNRPSDLEIKLAKQRLTNLGAEYTKEVFPPDSTISTLMHLNTLLHDVMPSEIFLFPADFVVSESEYNSVGSTHVNINDEIGDPELLSLLTEVTCSSKPVSESSSSEVSTPVSQSAILVESGQDAGSDSSALPAKRNLEEISSRQHSEIRSEVEQPMTKSRKTDTRGSDYIFEQDDNSVNQPNSRITAKRLKQQLASAKRHSSTGNCLNQDLVIERMHSWLESLFNDENIQATKDLLTEYVRGVTVGIGDIDALLNSINQLRHKPKIHVIPETLPAFARRASVDSAHTTVIAVTLYAIEMLYIIKDRCVKGLQ
ncbi:hypothetical protein BG011_009673 [Mortierella polycephala]|uniref:Uncharacterized protein n=1 Tax=Mortierella polycephala TaxID=41804 RepID=A0A9P6PMY7_9FUNG|nr:hypothetical protein BG011_009673 [Mortierella polycephala]